jgi:hypothetical protein
MVAGATKRTEPRANLDVRVGAAGAGARMTSYAESLIARAEYTP